MSGYEDQARAHLPEILLEPSPDGMLLSGSGETADGVEWSIEAMWVHGKRDPGHSRCVVAVGDSFGDVFDLQIPEHMVRGSEADSQEVSNYTQAFCAAIVWSRLRAIWLKNGLPESAPHDPTPDTQPIPAEAGVR